MNRTRRAAAVALSVLMVGAGATAAIAKTVGQSDSGSSVSLAKGKSLVIKLKPANSGSSGFHWRVAKKPASSTLKLKSNKTKSGKQVFTYKAAGKGTTSLKLQYVAPAQGAKPTKTFKLTVTVK